MLELKQIEVDFDYNKHTLHPLQFEDYCLMNTSKLSKLEGERREEARLIEEAMLARYLQRDTSTD